MIVVVGAGISGLVAARAISAAGFAVTVLEAGDVPGGRMRTETVGGWPFELGAQFLSSGYRVIPRVLNEEDLTALPTATGTAILFQGRLHRFETDSIPSLLASGLLGWRSVMAAPSLLATLAGAHRDRAEELTSWLDHDRDPGELWSRRAFGDELTDALIAPTINGFYFQRLAGSSGALPAAVAGFATGSVRTWSLEGGLGTLTSAMADGLDVRCGVRVTALTPMGVDTSAGPLAADRIVLAVPGAAAKALHRAATPLERSLMAVPYSGALVVGLPTAERLHRDDLADAYGVLAHPDANAGFAALAVASRAHPHLRRSGDLVTVMFDGVTSARLHDARESEVVAEAWRALRPWAPSVRPHPAALPQVVRWAEAMPTVPVGHGAAVAAYWAGLSRDARVVLAGDYLGFPWSDSAAANGERAARFLLGLSHPERR
ncbi:MAG: FAD-dependent oxidoreductase [Micropruina sp.]|jgi:oxygen-dependent protoporphyrinogen oxidase|nr:FAD-dependent oxidoreductase [Micropruina sp.]HBX82857.1 hypothetical protein [Propionibacteriaceae bacterium]